MLDCSCAAKERSTHGWRQLRDRDPSSSGHERRHRRLVFVLAEAKKGKSTLRPILRRKGRGGPGLHHNNRVFVTTTDTSAEAHPWFRRYRYATEQNQTRGLGDVFGASYVSGAPGCGDAVRMGAGDALLRPLQGHIRDIQVTLRSQLLLLEERLPPVEME
jgi:hypothetical protein